MLLDYVPRRSVCIKNEDSSINNHTRKANSCSKNVDSRLLNVGAPDIKHIESNLRNSEVPKHTAEFKDCKCVEIMRRYINDHIYLVNKTLLNKTDLHNSANLRNASETFALCDANRSNEMDCRDSGVSSNRNPNNDESMEITDDSFKGAAINERAWELLYELFGVPNYRKIAPARLFCEVSCRSSYNGSLSCKSKKKDKIPPNPTKGILSVEKKYKLRRTWIGKLPLKSKMIRTIEGRVNRGIASEIEVESIHCTHCNTKSTSFWRRIDKKTVCNACYLYYREYRRKRPVNLNFKRRKCGNVTKQKTK